MEVWKSVVFENFFLKIILSFLFVLKRYDQISLLHQKSIVCIIINRSVIKNAAIKPLELWSTPDYTSLSVHNSTSYIIHSTYEILF